MRESFLAEVIAGRKVQGKRLRRLIAPMLIGWAGLHAELHAQSNQATQWYWVNTVKKQGPDCVRLNEDPLSSVVRHFGNVKMRIALSGESHEGRLIVVEIEGRGEVSRLAYATSEVTCRRLKNAASAVTTEMEPSIQTVSPGTLQSFPKDYEGKVVQFTVRVLGKLSPESPGRSRVYIDDYRYLTPILQGEVLRRWIQQGLDSNGGFTVTLLGRVRTKSVGAYVDFDVEDFRRE